MTETEENMIKEIISELRKLIVEGRELIETIKEECEDICSSIRESGHPGGGGRP